MYFDELRLSNITKDPGVCILSYLFKMRYKYVGILKLLVDSSFLFVNLNILETVLGLRTEIMYYLHKYVMFKVV